MQIKTIKSSFITNKLVLILLCFTLIAILIPPVFKIMDKYMLLVYIILCTVAIIETRYSDFKLISIIFTCLFISLLSIILNSGRLGSVVTYVCSMLICIIYTFVYFNNKEKLIIKIVCAVVIVSLLVLSLLYKFKYDMLVGFMSLLNSNTYAQFVCYSYIIIVIFDGFVKDKIINNIILAILFVLTIITILFFGSRASLICILTFGLLNLTPKKFLTKKNIIIVVIVAFVISMIVPIIYVTLFNYDINVQVLGKNLYTGREEIWQEMFSCFGTDAIAWLIGLGSDTILRNGYALNVHNNFWGIIVNFGFFGLVTYLVFVWYLLNKIDYASEICYKSMFGYVSTVLLMGTFEIVTLWPVTFIITAIFLGVASNKSLNTTLLNKGDR